MAPNAATLAGLSAGRTGRRVKAMSPKSANAGCWTARMIRMTSNLYLPHTPHASHFRRLFCKQGPVSKRRNFSPVMESLVAPPLPRWRRRALCACPQSVGETPMTPSHRLFQLHPSHKEPQIKILSERQTKLYFFQIPLLQACDAMKWIRIRIIIILIYDVFKP